MEKKQLQKVTNQGIVNVSLEDALPGTIYREVCFSSFKAECRMVRGMGKVWLVVQKGYPQSVLQVEFCHGHEEFQDKLYRAHLGGHRLTQHVQGCEDFFLMYAGCWDDLKPEDDNPQRFEAITLPAMEEAACWWKQNVEKILVRE